MLAAGYLLLLATSVYGQDCTTLGRECELDTARACTAGYTAELNQIDTWYRNQAEVRGCNVHQVLATCGVCR